MRSVRQLGTIAAAVLVAAGGVAACRPWGRATARSAPGSALRVGLVFDVGGRGDGAFNDAAYTGAEQARKSLGVDVAYGDGANEGQRRESLEKFAREGRDLVIGVGFLASGDVSELAAKYPNTRFAVLDFSLQSDASGRTVLPPANLAGIVFREEEGSYLVGAVAGLTTRTDTVGFIGGMTGPLIRKFEAGYAAGVERTCPTCRVIAEYVGSTPAAFDDPAAGRRIASAQYGAGADVIFHAAGASGNGLFAEAAARDKLAIGVDADQSKHAPGHVMTSMLKRIDVAVVDVIGRAAHGTFQGGLVAYGLAEGGIDYVYGDANRALIPDSAHTAAEVLRAAITAGLVRVPTTR